MPWTSFWIAAVVFLLLSVVYAIIKGKSRYKSGSLLDLNKILFVGVVVSSVILFIPIYLNVFKESNCGFFETLLISVHNMIRLFVVDGDYTFITDNLVGLSDKMYTAYTVLFAILFVMAPLLTFGFVMSFFKNVSAQIRYRTHYKSKAYIFSELNERSIALASSLYDDGAKGKVFVFTDVFESDEESTFELIEKAKELGAILFKKDMLAVDFSVHSKGSELNFFAIGKDQSENISHALKIADIFRYRENTNLYLFSTGVDSEMLISGAFEATKSDKNGNPVEPAIKIRRVNEVQSLINRNLYEKGYENIFQSACEDEKGVKRISAVIVGMGQHGTEMTKALSWFCQMDGYEVEINCFDTDKMAKERFTSLCPELMSDRFNGKYIEGEARYKITVHSEIDAFTSTFDEKVASLPAPTYVFIALGSDENNISCAVKLRAMFERMGIKPVIQAVVYSSEKKKALRNVKNFKGQSYDIDFIGDIRYSYSAQVIMNSDVEKTALERHLKWGKESDFWRYVYNYNSSIASAIHRKMKICCRISGVDKNPEEREEKDKWALRELEHRRWNAYMRSDGYCFAETRNDLAKTHHCLVPFASLSEKEQKKDDD